MKVKYLCAVLSTAIIAGILLPGCESKDAGINGLPPERIREVTARAYIMCYPLVMNYATMYKQAVDADAAEYVGGFGKFRHYGFATADNRDIVSPNNDTPYSWGWVDLRSEPWVLLMPEADEGRYYTSQWDDLWGFVLDSPGSILDGQGGGTYLLATVEWEGDIPAGIRRAIRGESRFLGTLTRTGADGPGDLANMEAIQAGYRLMPLHEYLGEPAPPAAREIDWIPFIPGEEATIEAFKYVNFLLPYIIPHESDKQILADMAKLGMAPGAVWDTSKFSRETKEAMEKGIADALAALDAYRPQAKSGDLFNTREVLKTDYTARMFGVMIGIFGNYASQAVYLALNEDSDGNQVNTADASYRLTFGKGETPPAEYFWSITMYGMPERFLVPNPIDRYSIGSRSPQLKTNADGSIDIYISKNSPGEALESNWLPAPNGLPSIVMRVYGPGGEVLNGTYRLPRLVKID